MVGGVGDWWTYHIKSDYYGWNFLKKEIGMFYLEEEKSLRAQIHVPLMKGPD